MKTTYSAIIPTVDRIPALVNAIVALRTQSLAPKEIIVVESSGRKDFSARLWGELARVNTTSPSLRSGNIIIIQSRRGLTRQRNRGVAAARFPWILFIDDDVEVLPTFAEELLTAIQVHGAIGGMGSIRGQPINSGKAKLVSATKKFFGMTHDFGDGRFMKSGLAGVPLGGRKPLLSEFASGGLTFWRKDICTKVQFDEKLVGYGVLEDADFSWRAHFEGKILYWPRAKVFHHHSTVGGRPDRYQLGRLFGRHYRYLFRKNFAASKRGSRLSFWKACLGYTLWAVAKRDNRWIYGFRAGLAEDCCEKEGG